MISFFDMLLPLNIAGYENTNNWPEVKVEVAMRGIYSHKCPQCKGHFFGYKRRSSCFKCVKNR